MQRERNPQPVEARQHQEATNAFRFAVPEPCIIGLAEACRSTTSEVLADDDGY
jgi:hypothetical protein